MHGHAYEARARKESFLHLILVWNESHIIWEPPQTPIFLLYKVIKDTFLKEEEYGGKTHKIH